MVSNKLKSSQYLNKSGYKPSHGTTLINSHVRYQQYQINPLLGHHNKDRWQILKSNKMFNKPISGVTTKIIISSKQ